VENREEEHAEKKSMHEKRFERSMHEDAHPLRHRRPALKKSRR
jgi:hypothetical protein